MLAAPPLTHGITLTKLATELKHGITLTKLATELKHGIALTKPACLQVYGCRAAGLRINMGYYSNLNPKP